MLRIGEGGLKTSYVAGGGGHGFFTAAAKINSNQPDMVMEVHKVGEHMDPGYNPKRVRIFINNEAIVAQTPVVG
ncbi:hypothetical protein BAE44_0015728 [Dichanthelium oligosanthes]|uniref:Uncharacterized protein n=1 Tax=Dichanthelium oligosanthes TaxID=888268 RepID=A0A1E5VDM8_9POAL|nr:hypothetical protein BAE44_0015728 [Dichanthelium oligosanthes]